MEKFKELSLEEKQKIQGGVAWIGIVIEIAGAFGVGFSIGYGAGSYDCDCPENDGRRLNEVGPSHYRA